MVVGFIDEDRVVECCGVREENLGRRWDRREKNGAMEYELEGDEGDLVYNEFR
jgi:hypothetical protein